MIKKTIRVTIAGVEYHRLEDVPEPHRSLIAARLASVEQQGEAAAASLAAGLKAGANVNFKVDVKPAAKPGPQPLDDSAPRRDPWTMLALVAAAAAFAAWLFLRHR